jgi:predicted nucleic acid-binding protein
VIVLDNSVLVAGLTGPVTSRGALRAQLEGDRPIVVPSLVLYEFLRGPRKPEEIGMQEALFPAEHAIPFGPAEAALSARLYRSVRRARGREIDLAIAACAILRNAQLWTLNTADFADIPDLRLFT